MNFAQSSVFQNFRTSSGLGNFSRAFRSLLAGFILALSASAAWAGAVRSGFDSSTLAATDDGSTAAVSIGFTANYFGLSFSQVFVNNNGNVTLGSASSTFTPSGLAGSTSKLFAPFFADVDTRGTGSGLTKYGTGTVNGRSAFGVSWVDVGYFNSKVDKKNSFQLIFIDRSDTGANNFDFEFNYDKALWETGSSSGGSNGLGGTSATVGYTKGFVSTICGCFFCTNRIANL